MMKRDQMRAAIVTKPGCIDVVSADIPVINQDSVLIKVKYCGICETDHHILSGRYSSEFLPLIPGHEFVGYVEELGSEVKTLRKGDFVTADINLGCGECFYCSENQVLMCSDCRQIGIHINGAFAEYVSVPAKKVYRLPETMAVENAALIEPVSNVVRTARRSGITFAKSVVIIGSESIGLLHLQMVKNCGASPIIMISGDYQHFEKARRMGADCFIQSSDNDVNLVKDLTEGRGADFVVETSGTVCSYEKAFQYVRPGGKVVGFGLTGIDETISIRPFEMVLKELSVASSVAGIGNDISDAITMTYHNRFDLKDFTRDIYPLDEIKEAFNRALNDKNALKVLVAMY